MNTVFIGPLKKQDAVEQPPRAGLAQVAKYDCSTVGRRPAVMTGHHLIKENRVVMTGDGPTTPRASHDGPINIAMRAHALQLPSKFSLIHNQNSFRPVLASKMNTSSRIRCAPTHATLLRRRVFYTIDRSKGRHRATRSDCSLARAKLQSLPTCRPFLAQLAVSTVKTTAADVLVQVVAEEKPLRDIDLRRTAIFAGFGFAYLGCFQWYLLINKYSKWFPTMKHFAALPLREKLRCKQGLIEGVKMVIFDVVVHSPMIYFPSYYTLKEFVGGSSWSPTDWVKYGLRKYYMNARQDLSAMAVVTIPSGKYN